MSAFGRGQGATLYTCLTIEEICHWFSSFVYLFIICKPNFFSSESGLDFRKRDRKRGSKQLLALTLSWAFVCMKMIWDLSYFALFHIWFLRGVKQCLTVKLKRIMSTIGGLGRHIGQYIDRYIGRLSTDYRPTISPQSTDYQSIVNRYHGRQLTDIVLDHRYSSATWPLPHQYMTDTWPTLDRHLTDTWPTLDRHLTDTWPNITDTWPIHDRYLTDT